MPIDQSNSDPARQRAPARLDPKLIAVFALALLARLAFLASSIPEKLISPDTPAYEDLALKIRLHEAYQTDHSGGPGGFPADLQRPPGYPLFLALLDLDGESDRVRVTSAQCVLGALIALGIAAGGSSLFGPGVGFVAGCWYALDWVSVVHAPLIMADTLFAGLVLLALLSFAFHIRSGRMRSSIGAGLLLGAACLVKPAGQVLVPIIFIAWLVGPRRSAKGLAFVIALTACVAPWMVRNKRVHDVATLSLIGTAAVYFYTAHGAVSDIGTDPKRLEKRVIELDSQWLKRTALTPAERNLAMRTEASDLMSRHWRTVPWQAGYGLARTGLGTARQTVAKRRGGSGPPSFFGLTVLPLAQILVLWAAAGMGAYTLFCGSREMRSLLVLFAGAILLILLPAASPLGNARYRLGAVPELCLLAGVGTGPGLRALRRSLDSLS